MTPIKHQAHQGRHILDVASGHARSYGAMEFLNTGSTNMPRLTALNGGQVESSWARFGLALGSSRFRLLGGGAAGKFEVSGSKFKVGDRGGRLPDRTPFSTGDWKVSGTRRQECRRYVAQAFQPAGSGDFSVAGASPSPLIQSRLAPGSAHPGLQ